MSNNFGSNLLAFGLGLFAANMLRENEDTKKYMDDIISYKDNYKDIHNNNFNTKHYEFKNCIHKNPIHKIYDNCTKFYTNISQEDKQKIINLIENKINILRDSIIDQKNLYAICKNIWEQIQEITEKYNNIKYSKDPSRSYENLKNEYNKSKFIENKNPIKSCNKFKNEYNCFDNFKNKDIENKYRKDFDKYKQNLNNTIHTKEDAYKEAYKKSDMPCNKNIPQQKIDKLPEEIELFFNKLHELEYELRNKYSK